MPDAQGTSSFIGQFLQGYMSGQQNAHQQRLQQMNQKMQDMEHFQSMAENIPISNPLNSASPRNLPIAE